MLFQFYFTLINFFVISSSNFNLIGCRKIEAVAGALSLGYDVVFSDVDIALLHDPIDFLLLPEVDYVHSVNIPCGSKFGWRFNHSMEGNTGFYAVRSNPRTIRTWDLTYRACSLTPLYDDQTMFWLILRTNLNPIASPLSVCPTATGGASVSSLVDPSSPLPASAGNNTVVSCPLDSCVFSAGGLRSYETYSKLQQALRHGQRPGQGERHAVMAHANWMNGRQNKLEALRRNGLWLAQWQPAPRSASPVSRDPESTTTTRSSYSNGNSNDNSNSNSGALTGPAGISPLRRVKDGAAIEGSNEAFDPVKTMMRERERGKRMKKDLLMNKMKVRARDRDRDPLKARAKPGTGTGTGTAEETEGERRRLQGQGQGQGQQAGTSTSEGGSWICKKITSSLLKKDGNND